MDDKRMWGASVVDVIIPARDEQACVGAVVARVPRPPVRMVLVVDNGSSDDTAGAARRAGATVVREPRPGYGAACLAGMAALPADASIVVFLDADGSDDPGLIPALLRPILEDRADLVVGARAPGLAERGAMTMPQRVGNAVAARWLRARFGLHATDLGPLRAIRRSSLDALGMRDRGYGWTVEMQIKAARARLRYVEVPVPYRRRRTGRSKVAGTLAGTVGAAAKILGLLAWHDIVHPAARRSERAARHGRPDPAVPVRVGRPGGRAPLTSKEGMSS
jgi:glycosyltransferase involved in cell wall biosynthesis